MFMQATFAMPKRGQGVNAGVQLYGLRIQLVPKRGQGAAAGPWLPWFSWHLHSSGMSPPMRCTHSSLAITAALLMAST